MMVCAAAAAFGGTLLAADSEAEIARKLVALERQAMDGWVKGNPDPDLATLDPSFTLFHPPSDKRLDGLAAVKEFYEKYRGMSVFDSYEIVDPKVQASGDIAVLTFHFDCQSRMGASRYFATQVWQQKKEGWKMIHAQWSKVRTQ
jgi:ketosteroid isomerase-like protein